MPAAFLQLRRNAEFWRTRGFPKAPQPKRKPCTGAAGLGGARVSFEGDPVVFQWYPGQGLQIQPLANFGKANALWRACAEAPPTAPDRARRRRPRGTPPPGRPVPAPDELRALARPHGRARLRARRLHRLGVLLRVRRRHAAVDQRARAGHRDPGADPRLAAARRPEVPRRRPPRARRVRAARRRSASARRRPPAPAATTSSTRSRAGCACSTASCSRWSGCTTSPTPTGDRRARRASSTTATARRGGRSALRHRRLVALLARRQRVRPRVPPARARLPRLAVRAHQRERLLRAGQALRPLPARAHACRPPRRSASVRAGRVASVRFTLSKLSCVTLRVRRGGAARARPQARPAARAARRCTYAPPRRGRYTVQVQAVDLLNHYTRVERPLVVGRARRARDRGRARGRRRARRRRAGGRARVDDHRPRAAAARQRADRARDRGRGARRGRGAGHDRAARRRACGSGSTTRRSTRSRPRRRRRQVQRRATSRSRPRAAATGATTVAATAHVAARAGIRAVRHRRARRRAPRGAGDVGRVGRPRRARAHRASASSARA